MNINTSILINGLFLDITNLTIIQKCDSLEIIIPRFCFHNKLAISGNCRICLIEEMTIHSKLVIACALFIISKMIIFTDTYIIQKSREDILEYLLINHPLDCPICDQGGECDLQEQTLKYGSDNSKYSDIKSDKRIVDNKNIGFFIKTIMTRCIHCTRCIRFLNEITDTYSLGLIGKGKFMEISNYLNSILWFSELSGNIIDLCPVNKFTNKKFIFIQNLIHYFIFYNI